MRNGRGGGSRGSRFTGFKNEHPNGTSGDESLPDDPKNDQIDSQKKAEFGSSLGKKTAARDTAQIEYLIHQSTLGVHFLFDKRDVVRVMMTPTDEKEFFTLRNMERVQSLLSRFLEKPTMMDKERFLRSLNALERDLMIRAYFHLVENAIQTNFDLKH
jgi:hypothetical protein